MIHPAPLGNPLIVSAGLVWELSGGRLTLPLFTWRRHAAVPTLKDANAG